MKEQLTKAAGIRAFEPRYDNIQEHYDTMRDMVKPYIHHVTNFQEQDDEDAEDLAVKFDMARSLRNTRWLL